MKKTLNVDLWPSHRHTNEQICSHTREYTHSHTHTQSYTQSHSLSGWGAEKDLEGHVGAEGQAEATVVAQTGNDSSLDCSAGDGDRQK